MTKRSERGSGVGSVYIIRPRPQHTVAGRLGCRDETFVMWRRSFCQTGASLGGWRLSVRPSQFGWEGFGFERRLCGSLVFYNRFTTKLSQEKQQRFSLCGRCEINTIS